MRAQLAETRRLATDVVCAFFSVVRLCGCIEADAFEAASRQLFGALSALMKREGAPFRILFTDDGVAAGRSWALLSPNSPQVLEIRQVLADFDADEVSFLGLPKLEDIEAMAAYFSGRGDRLPETVEISKAAAPILGGDQDSLTRESRAVRAYVSAVLIMRHVFQQVGAGNFKTLAQVNRAAELLSSEIENPAMQQLFLRSQSSGRSDPATLAVLTALLTLLLVREMTEDRDLLRVSVVSSLLFDIGRARLNHPQGSHRGLRIADARPERLPASSAVVLIAMAGFGEKAVERTIAVWEAQCSRRVRKLDAVYPDDSAISNLSLLIATVRRYVECMQADPATSRSRTPIEALGILAQETPGLREYWVISLLAGYLGVIPTGSCVELSTNWQGVVWDTGPFSDKWQPRLRLVRDPFGRSVKPVKVDLAQPNEDADYYGELKRVIHAEERSLLKMRKKTLASVDVVSQSDRSYEKPETTRPEHKEFDQEHLSLDLFEALGREGDDDSMPVSRPPSVEPAYPALPDRQGIDVEAMLIETGEYPTIDEERTDSDSTRTPPSVAAVGLGATPRRLAAVTFDSRNRPPDLEEKKTAAMDKEVVDSLLGAFMPASREERAATTTTGSAAPTLQEQETVVDPTPPGMPHLAQQLLSSFTKKPQPFEAEDVGEDSLEDALRESLENALEDAGASADGLLFEAAETEPQDRKGMTTLDAAGNAPWGLEDSVETGDTVVEETFESGLDIDIDIDVDVDVEFAAEKIQFTGPPAPMLPEQKALLGTPDKPLRSNLDTLPTREVSGREARNLLHGFMPPGSGDVSNFGARPSRGPSSTPKPQKATPSKPVAARSAEPKAAAILDPGTGSGILKPSKRTPRHVPAVTGGEREEPAKPALASSKKPQKSTSDLPQMAILKRAKARRRTSR